MRIDRSIRASQAPSIVRVQRSRPYADYRLLDEHDPLVHSGAEEQERQAAASDAAQSIAALMQQLADLKLVLEHGFAAFRRTTHSDAKSDRVRIESVLDKLNGCLYVFEKHPVLRRSLRQSLCEPFLSSRIQALGIILEGHTFVYTPSSPPSTRQGSRLSKRPLSEANEPLGIQAVFGLHGTASELRIMIEHIERSPASALLEPELLVRLYSTAGTVYSPFMRMYTPKRMNLLLSMKG